MGENAYIHIRVNSVAELSSNIIKHLLIKKWYSKNPTVHIQLCAMAIHQEKERKKIRLSKLVILG